MIFVIFVMSDSQSKKIISFFYAKSSTQTRFYPTYPMTKMTGMTKIPDPLCHKAFRG